MGLSVRQRGGLTEGSILRSFEEKNRNLLQRFSSSRSFYVFYKHLQITSKLNKKGDRLFVLLRA